MLLKRTLVALALLPLVVAVILLGGPVFTVVVAGILGLAAREFSDMFIVGKLHPASFLLIGGTVALVIARDINGFESAPWLVSLIILAAMTFHLVAYERGDDQAGTGFAVTIAGIMYIGFLGSYLISIRNLPNGEWWLLVILLSIWLADVGAYLIGSPLGKHKMTVRLSPKKSWEGFLGGMFFCLVGTVIISLLIKLWFQPQFEISLLQAFLVGLLMSTLPVMGDLGVSMIKRQVGVKDSGTFLPGHGGALDRIDTWMWGVVIGYYLVIWVIAV